MKNNLTKQITTAILTQLLAFGSVIAQSNNQNYIIVTTPTTQLSKVDQINDNNSNSIIQYFDGLGRPIQTVQRGITPTMQDLATLTEYDGAGRENIQWLPVPIAGNNGAYVDLAAFKTEAAN